MARTAWRKACFAFSGSREAIASRANLMALFTPLRTAALRNRRRCAWRFLFCADLVFAKVDLLV